MDDSNFFLSARPEFPLAEAEALIRDRAEMDKKKEVLIASLRQQRESIDKALVALGAKRVRKARAKVGRPVGSRNKKNVEVTA